MGKDYFKSPDYYKLDKLLSDEQKMVRDSVRDWVKENVSPIIESYSQMGKFPKEIIKGLAEIGGFGSFLPTQYGGSEIDFISYGLMMQELERGDSSIRVLSSIQTSLVMNSIFMYGNEDQKNKYLPLLANGELIGSFGMTEPDHGSDPSEMKTNYKENKGSFEINGSKMWIGQAPICDIAVIWAKGSDNSFASFIVERNFEGFSTSKINDKWSYRASDTGELIFNKMIVPKENLLKVSKNLKDALHCLNIARYGVAWGSLGIAMECYDVALNYSVERVQFGKKIASFQLIQKKLSDMLTEITKSQILTWRLGVLMDEKEATFEQISMAKRSNISMACDVARISRSILGGMGITGEYPIMRHLMNLETLVTYLGSEEIHTLISGRDITGISAFR